MATLLETHGLVKYFGNFCALSDVSISVERGTVFGLLGPNGAGKTTLIRLINRIISPDGGTILLDGRELADSDVKRIGYLPEERGLYKKMKVGEQAVYLAQLKGLSRREAEKRLHAWFDKLEIGSWWNRQVGELSKGMQQKVQFVVTVVHEPTLLIFDEPFSGFDPVNAAMLRDEILELRRNGATVLLSTHNMASVEELCDDIALIDHSQVVLAGNVRKIRRSFCDNVFSISVQGSELPVLPDGFELVGSKSADDECEMQVKMRNADEPNRLLQALLQQRKVLGFHEMLPAMNDVFIKAVSAAKE